MSFERIPNSYREHSAVEHENGEVKLKPSKTKKKKRVRYPSKTKKEKKGFSNIFFRKKSWKLAFKLHR